MKKAIALIELIFAIVVIGITLLAVPNLLNTTNRASNNAITQEAVSNAASHLEMIMSQYWDENSIQYNNNILYVKTQDNELFEKVDSKGFDLGIRAGSNKETPRRFALDENGNKVYATDASYLGREGGESQPDDIDDFANTNYNLVNIENANVENGEYKDNRVQISTSVYYISDSISYADSNVSFNNPFGTATTNTRRAQSTNIKAIQVTITSLNDNKNIVFNGFSCNIGAQQLRRRDF